MAPAYPRPFARPWDERDPLATPTGLSDPRAAAGALEAAATRIEAAFGAIDVPWGQVYRFVSGDVNLPANGGSGDLGIFSVISYDNERRANNGDTFVAAIEFSRPVRATAILSYGNSSQPGSPHAADQLPLLVRKQMRPVWRTRQELAGHLEARESLRAVQTSSHQLTCAAEQRSMSHP